MDPIGLAGGDTNLYRYVRNNPIQYTDPNGREVYNYTGRELPKEFLESDYYKQFKLSKVDHIFISDANLNKDPSSNKVYLGQTTKFDNDSKLNHIEIDYSAHGQYNESVSDTLIHEAAHAYSNSNLDFLGPSINDSAGDFDHAVLPGCD